MKYIRFLLFPLAILYDLITTIRNILFDKGILKSTRFKTPIIAVGNLNVGGTGKTPQIEYLINLLQNKYKIAVLSRGYKRKSKGFLVLNSTHCVEDTGDEPLQFFKKFKSIQVAVDNNRSNGIGQLLKRENAPEVILLDDAFQHRKVVANFYILLTKYNDLYSNDYVLPAGNLRENKTGSKRAKMIIITKCPSDLSEYKQKEIIKKLKPKIHQHVFFTTISYSNIIKGNQKNISAKYLQNYSIVLVTGIANSTPLINYLHSLKIMHKHLKFSDHHHFSKKDIQYIKNTFKKISSKNKIILTTQKDYVRLSNKIDNLFFIEIETSFLKDKKYFDSTIFKFIENNNFFE